MKFEGIDVAALADFVRKRRKESGGYGATRLLPATVEDTFQAVRILELLKESGEDSGPRDTALGAYLKRTLDAPWLGIRTTFQMLSLCRWEGIPIDTKRVLREVDGAVSISRDLATLYHAGRIAVEVLGEEAASVLGHEPRPTMPERRAVGDILQYLSLCAMLHQAPFMPAELVRWLRDSQNGDGGFGFFPGTTSFIENGHFCLAALDLLNAGPEEREEARAFVVSCQTGRGGFSRNPRAAPFLDASWHGLESLRLLAMPRPIQ